MSASPANSSSTAATSSKAEAAERTVVSAVDALKAVRSTGLAFDVKTDELVPLPVLATELDAILKNCTDLAIEGGSFKALLTEEDAARILREVFGESVRVHAADSVIEAYYPSAAVNPTRKQACVQGIGLRATEFYAFASMQLQELLNKGDLQLAFDGPPADHLYVGEFFTMLDKKFVDGGASNDRIKLKLVTPAMAAYVAGKRRQYGKNALRRLKLSIAKGRVPNLVVGTMKRTARSA